MGLDISHDAYCGAYGSFTRFREEIWVAAGGKLIDHPLGIDIDWNMFDRKNYDGDWDVTPEDPLLVLIVHSDCDGYIYPEQLGPLIERLKEILPNLRSTGEGHLAHLGMRGALQKFITGAELALKNNEPLEFW